MVKENTQISGGRRTMLAVTSFIKVGSSPKPLTLTHSALECTDCPTVRLSPYNPNALLFLIDNIRIDCATDCFVNRV